MALLRPPGRNEGGNENAKLRIGLTAPPKRAHRDSLGPVRDAALVAARGFTVAARPSEWLASATWADLDERTVQLRAVRNDVGADSEVEVGLKTGARVALLLPNAYDRLMTYRKALEGRFGKQPDNALIFQVLSRDGPLWYEDGFPVEWSADHYKRWTARVSGAPCVAPLSRFFVAYPAHGAPQPLGMSPRQRISKVDS